MIEITDNRGEPDPIRYRDVTVGETFRYPDGSDVFMKVLNRSARAKNSPGYYTILVSEPTFITYNEPCPTAEVIPVDVSIQVTLNR